MNLTVVKALGLVTVQDLGRPGRMHQGLSCGGALVPGLLVAANRAVGNRDGSAAIEVLGQLVVRADIDSSGHVVPPGIRRGSENASRRARPGKLSLRNEARVIETSAGTVAVGQSISIQSEPRRVAYLAIRGGVAAEMVLGGCGAHLTAGLGQRLAAGLVIRSSHEPRRGGPVHGQIADQRSLEDDAPIQLIPGPDGEAFATDALARLCSAPYRVLPTSNRVGTRLEGPIVPRLPGHDRSRPMVRGALEVPPDGAPIVLGPEHPTIGGYPIVAVVASLDLDRLFATRVGGNVRFKVR